MPPDRHRTSPEPADKLPPQRSPARRSAHAHHSARAGASPTTATVHRRQLLLGLAVGALALGTGLSLQDPDTVPGHPIPAEGGTNPGAAQPAGAFPPTTTPAPAPATPLPPITRVPAPRGIITALPGTGNLLALTVDDGTSSDVVAAYTKFCTDTGVRLTFFVNGANRSWTDNAPALRPLVESGQVLLANHTWSHPNITTLSRTALREEITRNDTFLRTTYGITGLPFFRPPYGHHNPTTDQVAADLGYPTIALWEGSLGDSSIITEDFLLSLARQWLQPQHIVIGHANHPAITHTYPQLLDIITQRGLRTVTLADVYTTAH